MKALTLAALAASLTLATQVFAQAQSAPAPGSHESHHSSEAPASPLAEGEVRRIDKDGKKLTIRHGKLEKLDMPPMTMVFQVKDLAMLDQVKVGDKIRFDAEKIGGAFQVTRIEAAN